MPPLLPVLSRLLANGHPGAYSKCPFRAGVQSTVAVAGEKRGIRGLPRFATERHPAVLELPALWRLGGRGYKGAAIQGTIGCQTARPYQ